MELWTSWRPVDLNASLRPNRLNRRRPALALNDHLLDCRRLVVEKGEEKSKIKQNRRPAAPFPLLPKREEKRRRWMVS